MEICHSHTALRFQEESLSARIPKCAPIVAAALSVGWRLANDGAPNHEDILIGALHIQDFKRISPKKVRRVIKFRFIARSLVFENEKFRVEQFAERCAKEPALLHAAQRRRNYPAWERLLFRKLAEATRSFFVSDPDAHDRQLIVPMYGDTAQKAAFAQQYENGFPWI